MGNEHDLKLNDKDPNNNDNKPWMYLVVIAFLIGLSICTYSIMRVDSLSKERSYNNTDYVQNISQRPEVNGTNSSQNSPTHSSTMDITNVPSATHSIDNIDESEVVNVGTTNTPPVVKGIYIPASTAGSKKIEDLITLAASTELNAFVIDVKGDNGKISYKMDNAMAKMIGADTGTISDIKALTRKLKSKNIYLIARIVAFKDPYLASKRHDLAIKNKNGTLYKDNNNDYWVNPYNKQVWNYVVGVASQAAKDGFDEIQFDYIRFSTGDEIKKVDFGASAKNKSKQEVITEFTKYACETLHPLGVAVSADVYGTIINSEIDSKIVGQDYKSMAKYLDYICPMIYPSHFSEGNYGIKHPDTKPYDMIYKVLMKSEEKLKELPKNNHVAIVRPWLQDFTASWITHHIPYTGEEVRAQIKGVYDAGYGEWMLWNSGCSYSQDGLLKK